MSGAVEGVALLREVKRMAERAADNISHELDRDPKWQPTRADYKTLMFLLQNIAATARPPTTPPARSYADGVELACALFEEAIGEGYPIASNKRDQCDHGKFGWEDCIACYDDALTAKITAIRLLSQGEKA